MLRRSCTSVPLDDDGYGYGVVPSNSNAGAGRQGQGTTGLSCTSLDAEAALPAPAFTPMNPTLPLRWTLPLCFLHRPISPAANPIHGQRPTNGQWLERQKQQATLYKASLLSPWPALVSFPNPV